MGSIPAQGANILHAAQHSQKKKKKKTSVETSAKQKHDGFSRKRKMKHGNLILADIFIRPLYMCKYSDAGKG